jgi:type I restriction enzyme R subunit
MSLHKEISFEDEICGHLAAHGWFHADGDAAVYDRSRALFPPDLIAWVKATQDTAWDALSKNHGTVAQGVLLDRIRKQLDDRGTLGVLRHGIELIGLRRPIALAQFKPAMAMNPDIIARHAATTGCGSCGRSAIPQRVRTASTLCCSSTGCRSPPPS